MYNYYDMQLLLKQFSQQLQNQANQIRHLEGLIQKLQGEMNELKERPNTTIEKIEYKFDQLKVETLEGTLNIGLNPLSGEQIEDFSVNRSTQSMQSIKIDQQSLYRHVLEETTTFLESDCPSLIQSLCKEKGIAIEDTYIEFMIRDVLSQIENRIAYYLNQPSIQTIRNQAELEHTLVDKLKNDIVNSLTTYINHLPNEMRNT